MFRFYHITLLLFFAGTLKGQVSSISEADDMVLITIRHRFWPWPNMCFVLNETGFFGRDT